MFLVAVESSENISNSAEPVIVHTFPGGKYSKVLHLMNIHELIKQIHWSIAQNQLLCINLLVVCIPKYYTAQIFMN